MASKRHRIGHLIFDLSGYGSEDSLLDILAKVQRVYIGKILPRLERVLILLSPPDQITEIEALEIELGDVHDAEWEGEFELRCYQEMEAKLIESLKMLLIPGLDLPQLKVYPEQVRLPVQMIRYLETGLWPGKTPEGKGPQESMMQLLLEQPREIILALQKVKDTELIARRIAYQMPRISQHLFEDILGRAFGVRLPWGKSRTVLRCWVQSGGKMQAGHHEALALSVIEIRIALEWIIQLEESADMKQLYRRLNEKFGKEVSAVTSAKFPNHDSGNYAFGTLLVMLFVSELPELAAGSYPRAYPGRRRVDGQVEVFWEMLTGAYRNARIGGRSPIRDLQESAEQEKLSVSAEGGRGLDNMLEDLLQRQLMAGDLEAEVSLSGLVLLVPYLPDLFAALDYLDGDNFKDEACAFRAVYLLHFLSTFDEEVPEPELVIPKLLSGIEIEAPVYLLGPLTDDEKFSAFEILYKVLEKWENMEDLSPEGLQLAYIQRNGILERGDAAWRLRVAPTGVDGPMAALPWKYDGILLPWMRDLLFVEW